jgi:hypothetical protein
MTSQQPHQSHPPAAQRAIPFHRFHRILRAGRNKPTRRRKHRRNRPLISAQQLQHNEFGDLAHSGFWVAQRFNAAIGPYLLQGL